MENRKIAGLDTIVVPGDKNGLTIVLLHGFGASADDLAPLSHALNMRPRPTWVFPNGPLEISFAPGYTGRAWFPVNMEALQAALNAKQYDEVANAFPPEITDARGYINNLIDELGVLPSHLIIGGFSQGAVLATDTLLHSPHHLAGLLILSGTLICEPTWTKLAPVHAGTPFFQSHGTNDAILPHQKAQNLEKLLQAGGFKGKLHTFEGGHEIPPSTLSAAEKFLRSY